MPQGLEVFAPNGVSILDTSSRVVKTGTINVGNITSNGAISIAPYTAAGLSVVPIVMNNSTSTTYPNISANSSTVRWYSTGSSDSFNANIRLVLL